MVFKNIRFRLNQDVLLNKGDIRQVNDILSSLSIVGEYNGAVAEIVIEQMNEDEMKDGHKDLTIESEIMQTPESKYPFSSREVIYRGKKIGSIFINYTTVYENSGRIVCSNSMNTNKKQ